MELSSIELHVFVSLTVILGSALIALIVDYLKGSNEQLREHNIELRIRREEEGRRSITEIRLLREQMVADAYGLAPVEQPENAARVPEPATAATTLAAQPEPAPSAQAIIEQAVERAVRNAAAGRAEDEPDQQSAPRRDRQRSTWWESATSKPQPRLEVVGRKQAAEEKKPGPPKQDRAPDSLLDHVIFATEPSGGAPPVKPSPAEPEAGRVVERVVLAARPAADLAAPEPSRVVFVTPLAEPGIPETSSLPSPEPAPVVVEAAPMEPAPVVVEAAPMEPAPVMVEAAPMAPAPVMVEAAPMEPAPVMVEAAPMEPAPVVVEAAPMEPAPAEFLVPEIELAAALAKTPQTETDFIPPAGEAEPRISISSGLAVRREPAREAGPKLVRPVAELPKGFFKAAEIATLIGQDQSLTGVVVAIGINDYQRALRSQSKDGAQELAGSVDRLIRSLISANDFAYRRADDEFIVVFPNEKGASAQNRIHQVAERLWDYQLRSLAVFSVMFSWGAVTVDEESFSEAVALATDEMSETRDSRRSFGMESLRARRRAVSF